MKNPALPTRYIAFFVTLASCFLSVTVAGAQSADAPSGTFVVRPAKVELTIEPGKSETRNIELSNGTALPLSIAISYEDIAPGSQQSANDEPVTLLGKEGGRYPLRDILSTPKKSIQILSGESVSIPVTVAVPRSAVPGGHYGSVVFSFTPVVTSGSPTTQNVAVTSRLATLFFVRVAGDVVEKGELVDFGLFNKEQFIPVPTRDAPLRFQISFTNSGTVHLNPYGQIAISPLWGEDILIPIDPWVVLPGATRFRELYTHAELAPGYYRATIEENRGYEDIVDTREVSFWVLPSAGQGLFLLIVVLVLTLLIRRSLALSKHFVASS